VYFIKSGEVEVKLDKVYIKTLKEGDFFGAEQLFD